LKEAKELAESLREDYNERLPYIALNGLLPNEFKKSYKNE
jgi:hypothetical protein